MSVLLVLAHLLKGDFGVGFPVANIVLDDGEEFPGFDERGLNVAQRSHLIKQRAEVYSDDSSPAHRSQCHHQDCYPDT